MKIKTILKTVGSLQIVLCVILIPMLIFSVNTIAPSLSAETMLFVRGFADVVEVIDGSDVDGRIRMLEAKIHDITRWPHDRNTKWR